MCGGGESSGGTGDGGGGGTVMVGSGDERIGVRKGSKAGREKRAFCRIFGSPLRKNRFECCGSGVSKFMEACIVCSSIYLSS